MTKEELDKILTDQSDLNPEWEKHFVLPLLSLQDASHKKYRLEAPPEFFGEGRAFADRLWECVDDSELQSLCDSFPEGAAQLCYLLSLLAFERLHKHEEQIVGIEPRDGKPFAALSFRAQEWLDEVEARNPGKTTRIS